jgi:hypothetical protein
MDLPFPFYLSFYKEDFTYEKYSEGFSIFAKKENQL